MKRRLTTLVQGHFDKMSGPPQTATLVVDPNCHSFQVRVKGRRAVMEAGLDQLSELVYQRAAMAKAAEARPAKPARRFKAKRGLL